jgi:hypothetical protein
MYQSDRPASWIHFVNTAAFSGNRRCIMVSKKTGLKIKLDKNPNNLPSSPVSDGNVDLEFKETTRLEPISRLISASDRFPFLKDEDIEREHQQFLDVVLQRANMANIKPLCLMPLTEHQKLMAVKAAVDYLRLKAGEEEAQ